MRKIKKINGYLVVKFNDRELREWAGTALGTYGVIDAELYTGTLEVDRSVMEYDDADSLEVAIEMARGLESELDAEEPDVTVTVIRETDERTTEKETVDPEALFNSEKNFLERQIVSYHYPDTDHRTAAHELYGFARALKELGIIEDGDERFSVALDAFAHVGPKAPNPYISKEKTDAVPLEAWKKLKADVNEKVSEACGEIARQRETFEHIPPELKKDRDARRLYSLGLALEGDCPQNDCTLYRNIFRMAQELDSTLDTLEGHAADILRRELFKNYRELREMYLFNHAIQSYKEAMQQ